MKKTVLNYLGVAARLPFAVAVGVIPLYSKVDSTRKYAALCLFQFGVSGKPPHAYPFVDHFIVLLS